MILRATFLALVMGAVPTVLGGQSPSRFAIAIGQALPTQAKFGFFPTIRGEWYATDPDARFGVLVDAYLSRAFSTSTSYGQVGSRVFKGTEYGAAASLVVLASPRKHVSPYLLAGVLGRVASSRDSTWTPGSYGVSYGQDKRVEPNVGLGARMRLKSGRAVRVEVRYYHGMVFFPLTIGMTF